VGEGGAVLDDNFLFVSFTLVTAAFRWCVAIALFLIAAAVIVVALPPVFLFLVQDGLPHDDEACAKPIWQAVSTTVDQMTCTQRP